MISSGALLALAACGDSTLSGIPYGSPDAGRDTGLVFADSSTTDPDSSVISTKDAASGPVRSVVAVGASFTCLLAKDRTVWCWGRNDVGQLGRDPKTTPSCGSFPCSPTPAKVEGLADVDRIAAGDDFACALDRSAVVWCWGNNDKGQLSVGEGGPSSFTPRKIILDVAEIAAGGAHACAIGNDGFVRCWGENTCDIFGFGKGTAGAKQVVAKQLTLPPQRQVSLGPDAMCSTDTLGAVLCWGADHNGSLGHDLEPAPPQCAGLPMDPVPKHVQSKATEIPIDNMTEAHMGLGVACGRRNDGQILCWGDNTLGALGQGTPDATPHRRAIEVPALKAVQLDVHGQTACVITAERLICWGDGQYGLLDSLGDPSCGNKGCRALGYAIPNMMPVRELSIGPGSIATIKSDLSVWMWGRNDSAELGLPSTNAANVACAGGASVCVPQPKALAGTPPLD